MNLPGSRQYDRAFRSTGSVLARGRNSSSTGVVNDVVFAGDVDPVFIYVGFLIVNLVLKVGVIVRNCYFSQLFSQRGRIRQTH